MRVLDFHSHFFSRSFFTTLGTLSPLPGSVDAKLTALSEKVSIELPSPDDDQHLDRWLAELDRHDVEHLVSFASLPPEIPTVARAVARAGGRLTAMAMVDPHPENAADQLADLLDHQGFAGALVFPALHHFHLADATSLLEVLNARGAILYVHCGILKIPLRDLLGLPRVYDLRYASPLELVPVANAYPDLKLVIPHFGAGFLRESLMVGAQCENIYVDTSSSNSWMRTQPGGGSLERVFERVCDVYGCDRVLFGTDSGTFPRGWRKDLFDEQHRACTKLGLSEAEREQIFGGNARRLLGLE